MAKRGTTRVLAGCFLTNVNEREIEKEKKKIGDKAYTDHPSSFFFVSFFSTMVRDSIRAWLISGWLRTPYLDCSKVPWNISHIRALSSLSARINFHISELEFENIDWRVGARRFSHVPLSDSENVENAKEGDEDSWIPNSFCSAHGRRTLNRFQRIYEEGRNKGARACSVSETR